MSTSKIDQIRLAAEADLEKFIPLVHPQRCLGNIHREVIGWWTREDGKSHQLLLLPRDHMKSALVAYRVAWEITKDPTLRVLYISSTANLATKQLKFIKDILTSSIYRKFWPEMINQEEGKREKWTESEISVDHPARKHEAVRDPTIFTAGLTTGIVGLHCDIAVLDDVVVGENAYTEDGRSKVRTQYSFLASIEGTDAREWVVGTRYHPQDLYNDLRKMQIQEYNDKGDPLEAEDLYETFERQVENLGDGTGEFLWPRQQRYDGKWFGFDSRILAIKREQYLDKLQFRAQYYNNPNDESSAPIKRDHFQYYEPQFLVRQNGKWFYKTNRLNIFAAIDFAYSLQSAADYTAIVIVGVDSYHNYYVLDIDRFKSNLILDYFNHILKLHQKWDFRKIRAEVTGAQESIVETLKTQHIRKHGLALAIDAHRPSRYQGAKEERILATLQPRYQNMQMWHPRTGNVQILEDELVLQKPPHDDVKDALTSAVDIAVPPSTSYGMSGQSNILAFPVARTSYQNKYGGY